MRRRLCRHRFINASSKAAYFFKVKCKSCNAPLTPDKRQRCSYCNVPLSQGKVLVGSLRIETVNQKAEVLIANQTRLPYVWSEIFSTAIDYQKVIQMHLLQGENEFVNENRSLGRFYFEVNPPKLKTIPQIEIIFSINLEGELLLSAVNLDTRKNQEFRGITLDAY